MKKQPFLIINLISQFCILKNYASVGMIIQMALIFLIVSIVALVAFVVVDLIADDFVADAFDPDALVVASLTSSFCRK